MKWWIPLGLRRVIWGGLCPRFPSAIFERIAREEDDEEITRTDGEDGKRKRRKKKKIMW